MNADLFQPLPDDERMRLLHDCLALERKKLDLFDLDGRIRLANAYMSNADLIANIQWRTSVAGAVAAILDLPVMPLIMRAEAGRPMPR